MFDSKLPGRATRMGFRLVAALLATVMLLQVVPTAAFARPALNPLDLAEAVTLALGDETPASGESDAPGDELPPSPGEDEEPDSELPSPLPEVAGIIVRMSESLGIMATQSIESDGMEVVDASGSFRLVEVSEGKSLEEALDDLRRMDSVAYAEPNYILRTQDAYDFAGTNDPLYEQQWGLERLEGIWAWAYGLNSLFLEAYISDGNPYDLNGNQELDETDDIEGLYSEAAQVVVAVIDTGVDALHDDLVGRVLNGRNVISDSDATADDSGNGHGTHIAGIIAAEVDNGVGIAGTAGKFPIAVLPVKALDKAGIGTMYDVAKAIRWAVDEGNARIINLSLGARLFDFPLTLADAVAHAQNKGALVFAAAGNDAEGVNGFYPACLPGVISVGASTKTNVRTSFSNAGSDILAPGEDIMSTLPVNDGVSQYGAMTGTSQACAFVSGTAALILSVFPDTTQGEMVTALDEGQVPYWTGPYSAWYILSAENAMMAAYSTDAYPDYSIEFVSPRSDSYGETRVAGELDLTVRVGDPSIVNKIEFTLGLQGEDVLIGTVDRSGITLGGYATVSWDSSTVPDGAYSIEATSYDDDDSYLDYDYVSLKVANGQTTGLIIEVVNPDGRAAAGALVTVHHVYRGLRYESAMEEELLYQKLWSAQADLFGRVMLPSTVATGGNEYLVTARGTNPAFFYWDVVRAPDTNVRLTAEGASTMEVSACQTDGSPLTGADVSVELLGDALPETMQPHEVIDFDESDNATNLVSLLTLNALGQGTVVLSHGNYNVRVTDRTDRYYLCSYGKCVDDPTEAVSFGSTPDDLNVFSLVPDPNRESASLQLECISDPHFPVMPSVAAGQPVTVTSGTFGGKATAAYRADGYLWTYEFSVKAVAAGGGEHEVGVGMSLSATIEPDEPGQSHYNGRWSRFSISYEDAFGNKVTSVKKGSAFRRPQVAALRDGGDEPLAISSYGWSGTSWQIPEDIILGGYTVTTAFEGGYFGLVESEPLSIEILSRDQEPAGPPADLTATFLYKGLPLSGVPIYAAVYANGSYYLNPYMGYTYTDEDGKIAWWELIEHGLLSQGDKIALIAVGTPEGDEWSIPLFLTKTLTIEEPPMSVTVNIEELYKVDLTAHDKNGAAVDPQTEEPLNLLPEPLFSVYRYEADGSPIGLSLWEHSENTLELLVAEGEYLFQASQSVPFEDGSIYYLSHRVNVTGETPVDGLHVSLDASDAGEFSIAVPESGRYTAPAIALYRPGVTQVPVFGFGPYWVSGEGWALATLYVSPGTYHMEGVITRSHADGLWCYWLTKDDDVVLSPSTQYEWTLGNSFDGIDTTFSLIPPNKTDYGIDEKVLADVRIEDGEGNRLVGMALNFKYLGGFVPSSLSSARVPGGGQVFIAHSDSSWDDIEAQTHEEIAPFITVIGPDGEEIHRYKNSGANYGYLGNWDPEKSSYWLYPGATRLTGGSTFFDGEYLIPNEAVGGDYHMAMELEIGPEGSFSRTADFKVLAVHAPPRLDALSPYVSSETVVVTGSTVAGADVTLYSSFEREESIVAGTATADGSGRFSVTASLQNEGFYEFTATSTVGDATSGHSAPVSVTVDRQKPGPVRDLQAEPLDASHIKLTWSAPAQEDLSGIGFYRVRRDGEVVANDVTPGENLEWQDSGLKAVTEYTYDVRAVDRAGNEADPVVVTVTTTAGLDAMRPTPPRNLSVILSGFKAALTWEPASDNIGVTGYKVYRWVKGAEPPTVIEMAIEDPDATSFSDPNYLDSSTTYIYAVVACDAAGNESITEGEDVNGIPAAVAEVTTRAMLLSRVQWSAPRAQGRLLDPDDDAEGNRPVVSLTAFGDTSRACKATVIFAGPYVNLSDDDPGNDGVYEVDLAEDTAGEGVGLGVYRGSVSIPAGTSHIVAISCVLSDQADNTALAEGARLPEDFASGLEVTVDSDSPQSESLAGAELKVWSRSLETGGRTTVNGNGTYAIDDLPPSGDYVLTLTSAKKVVLATQDGLALSGGMRSSVVVRPQIPSTFRIKVLKGDGSPAAWSSVSVTKADGTHLSQGTVAYAGFASLPYPGEILMSGTQIVVTVIPASTLLPKHAGIAGMRFVLGPDANEFTVTLPERNRASLSGRVVTGQEPDAPLGGASISAYQTLDGQQRLIKSLRTDASGNYSLELYEGPVRLVVNHHVCASTDIQLETPLGSGENRQYDIRLPISKAISLTVNTKKIGEPEYAMDMDWRVAVHLHVSVRNLGAPDNPKNASAGSSRIEDGVVKIPDAEPGDVIRITADGRECGMTTDTVEVTLDENCWARAVVNLIEKGTVKAKVTDTGGNSHDGLVRYAELFKVDEQGAHFIETLKSAEETVTSKPLDPGTYSLVFHWAPLPSVVNVGGVWLPPLESLAHLKTYLGDDGAAAENLTFTEKPVLDIGTVRLPLPASVKPGYFRGAPGNDLVPNKYESGPGGIITMRGSYRYEGGVGLRNPKLLFGIPYGAELVPGSVVATPLEGLEPRTATRPDAVELSFGYSMSEPFSGTVVYRVKMPDDPDTAVCEVRMWAEHSTSGRGVTEDIVTFAINVPYVSIVAPSMVWDQSRETEVSGKATPFATVRVYDSNYFLAETRASENGTWKTTVVLPDRGRRANHFLRAEVILAQTDDDTTRPDWPSGARLSASRVESKSVTLSWPEAQDEVRVIQYVVTGYLTDESVAVVRTAFPSGQSDITLRVDDLLPGTDYSFKVEAMNASYNWSLALTLDVKTSPPDSAPPSWPGGAQLTASEIKFTSLRLAWPAATDNEGLKEYRVSCSPVAGTLARPKTVPADTNTMLVEGLSRGRQYVFRLEAMDINGNVAALSRTVATLQYDTELPVWPQGAELTATALDTEVTLNWPTALDNVQISNYPIYQLTGTNWILKANGYGNSNTIKQLSPETTYSFRVEARDSSGNCVSSPLEITVTTPSRDRTPPQWGLGDRIEVYDKTQTGFRIRIPEPYDESGISHYAIKDHQSGRTYTGSITYFDGLTRGQTYTYTVLAQDTRGNRTPDGSGLTFSVTVEPEDATPPSWPTGSHLTIPEIGPNNAEVIWTPAQFDIDQTGLPSYLIQARDGERVVWGTTVGQNISTWAVGGLQPGRTYTISVEAIDEWGNVSTNGPQKTITTPTSDTQAPRWPEGAVLEAYGMQKAREGTYTVLFQWPFAMDFELHHYEISARDSQGQPAPSSPTVTQQTAWHMWGLNPGETYTVEVTAKDLSGNVSSALSATVVTPGGMSDASLMSLSGSQGAPIKAQSDGATRTVSSAAAKVEYDQDAVRIESVTMQQSNGRVVDFEPVGRFVYVFVPGTSFSFDVTFNKPERVSELRILAENGAELGGALPTPPHPGMVIGTTGTLRGSKTIPGKLFASYMSTPPPFSIGDLPAFDEDVQRSSMPTQWGGATFPTCTVTYDDEGQNSGSASVKALLGDPRMGVDLEYTFSQILDGSDPEPSWSFSIVGNTRARFSVAVALDSSAIRGQMGSQAWYDTPKVLVRVVGETWVEGGLNIHDLFSTVSGMHDQQNYEMDLDDLLNGLDPDCPSHHLEYFQDLIDIEKAAAKKRTIAECAVGLGSIALGVAFPGIGFAVGSFLAGQALERYNDSQQAKGLQHIKDEIADSELCKPKKPEWKKDLIADPTWILDPAGYVYEVAPDNRIEGVMATALQNVGGIWTQWDATWYEQDNPLTTDAEGRYAWDVPEGQWKVSFEKEGYEPAESREMDVPPPHTDVNVSMVTTEAPSVVSVRADSGDGVDIVFDKHMRTSTVTPGTVTVTELDADGAVKTDDAGAPVLVSGAVQAIDTVADPGDPGLVLARVFRFAPDFPLVIGDRYRVRIGEMVESYTGLCIDGEHVATVVASVVVPVTGVRLSRHSVTLEVGASTTLGAEVVPGNATEQGVSWSSGSNLIATVTQSGIVEAVSVGTAIVTVTTNDGGYQDTCSVSVIERDAGYDPGPEEDGGERLPADILAEETHVVGPGQTTLSVMDGILVLEIPAGAFSPGTELVIRRLQDDAAPADSSLSVVASPTYEILIQGSGPAKPVTIRFMYCALCLKGMDPRKIGVYREDDSNPGNYIYIGGTIDSVNHTITVGLSGFSRYVVLGRGVTFGDIANHWGRNEIEVLASRYLVSGVSSTEFQPDRLVTRAELAKMLVGMLALDSRSTMPGAVPSSPSFTDVGPDAWYYSAVETASALGLIQGDGGLFRPNDPVTRQEMAIMLGRALGDGYSVPDDAKRALPFDDVSDISVWAVDGVASAWYWGLMQGVGGDTFQPLGNATRAQAAVVVLRMLELKGLVSNLVTLKGALSVSEIGGRHFELVGEDKKVYVILPETESARTCLEEAAAEAVSSGSVPVTVIGVLSDGPSVYMRGQIVKAILVDR